MDFLIKDADITLLCPAGLTFLQLSQLLTQRHASLRGRQVYYRLRGSAQVCSVPRAPFLGDLISNTSRGRFQGSHFYHLGASPGYGSLFGF